MSNYRHTQVGILVLSVLGIGAVVSVAFLLFEPVTSERYALGAVVGFLLLLMYLFGSLRVEIDATRLVASFGPGLIRRTIMVPEIIGVRAVRNPWYFGYGVRLTPYGWMFNVSGLDAVEVELTSGSRFRIGTDDPQGLVSAVQHGIR